MAEAGPGGGAATTKQRCASCGAMVAVARPGGATGLARRRVRCAPCRAAGDRRSGLNLVVVALAAGALGLVGLALAGPSPLVRLLLVWGGWFLVAVVQVVPHEGGHAAVARLLGFTVHRVSLGEGRCLASWRWGGTVVDLREVPLGGVTVASTGSARAYRLRRWLVVAGGPAATAAIALVAWRWPTAPGTVGAEVRAAVVWTGVLLLATNLVPWRTQREGGEQATDGWSLLAVPFLSRAQVAEQVALHDAVGAIEQLATDPEDAVARARAAIDRPGVDPIEGRLVLLVALTRSRRWSEAAATCRQVLDELPADDERRAVLLNDLAWSDLLLDDGSLLDEADRCSARALELAPGQAAIEGTRGGVLVALGRFEEALGHLRASQGGHLGRAEQALTHALVSMAESGRGNRYDGRRHLDAAVAADRTCELVPRAREALARAERAAGGTPGT